MLSSENFFLDKFKIIYYNGLTKEERGKYMNFTAIVPITRMETRTYDINVPEDDQKIIKAYEKWYDNMSKENEISLINTIKASEPDFDEKIDNFEDYVDNIIYDIRNEIYNIETDRGNTGIYAIDDILELADGKFYFI